MPTYIVDATIAEIRLLTTLSKLSDVYYSTDAGKRGIWNRTAETGVPADDNTGTILIDASGYKWKRLIDNDGYMPEWFGAFGDATTDDTAAINAAIAAANGGTVFFTGGKTYAVTTINVNNNVSLNGSGKLLRIADIVIAGSLVNSAVIAISSSTATISNVKIEGITIDGNRLDIEAVRTLHNSNPDIPFPAVPAFYGISAISNSKTATEVIRGVFISNISIINTYSEAIKTECCSNITIDNCTIENCQQRSGSILNTYNAITLSYDLPTVEPTDITAFSSIIISECLFNQETNYNSAIKILATGADSETGANTLSDVKVLNSSCNIAICESGCPSSIVLLSGIECNTSGNGYISEILISGNTINCQGAGSVSEKLVYGIRLTGNSGIVTTPSNGLNGIFSAIIDNNQIRNCNKSGIELIGTHITVVGNEFDNCGLININANNVQCGMNAIKIIANTIKARINETTEESVSGILLCAEKNNMTDILIEDNVIEGNLQTVESTTTTTGDLVYLKTGTGDDTGKIYTLTIANNHLLSITKNGIVVNSSVNAEELNISGNIFSYANTLPGTAVEEFYGLNISAKSLKNVSITNNTFMGLTADTKANALLISNYGSEVSSAYDNIAFVNNSIDNFISGILISASITGLILTQNFINNSTDPLEISADCTRVILDDNVIPGYPIGTPLAKVTYLNTIFITDSGGPYTASVLNTDAKYGKVAIGQTVICTGIDIIYKKVSATGWVQYSTTDVPAV